MSDHRQRSFSNYRVIWDTVRQVPRGKVTTYGEVAALSGLGGQARLVGYALHSLPKGSTIPWHRVINAQGKISFPERSSLYRRQLNLLKKDGVIVRKGRIDLVKCGWLISLQKRYEYVR